jgi:hypothetical protein
LFLHFWKLFEKPAVQPSFKKKNAILNHLLAMAFVFDSPGDPSLAATQQAASSS